ncbi:MAG: rhomboid family intramembrane serine protease [Planctomycetota bacterium]
MQFAFPAFTGWIKRLVILNAAVFFAIWIVGFASPAAERWVMDWLALNPDTWRAGFPAVWQFVTYGFLHSQVSLSHLVFNMLVLWFFGSMVQDAVGDRRLLAHYLIAVAVGGALHLVYALLTGQSGPVIGASGGASMLLVSAAVLRPNATVIFFIFPVKLWVIAAISVGFDAFAFLNEFKGIQDGIAHSVHLAGAGYGYLATKRRWLWKDPLAIVERKRAVAQMQRQMSDDARMDQLMQKISREGMPSLTRSERAFLQKQSERKRSG